MKKKITKSDITKHHSDVFGDAVVADTTLFAIVLALLTA